MKLQVLISTYDQEGVDRVSKMFLPELDNVSYLISVQNPHKKVLMYPDSILRKDILITEIESKGLGLNRNHSIDESTGDILLISDDDLIYTVQGLKAVIHTFEENSDIDIATFRYLGGDNKKYPDYEFDLLQEPKGCYITSFEIAIRKSSIPTDIRFSKYLGAGNTIFSCGEENLFVYRLLKAGLKGRFFPITIVEHPELTTGSRQATAGALRGQGNWLRLRYGTFIGFLRLIRDIPRKKAPWYKSLFFMTQGFILSYFYFTKDGKDRQKNYSSSRRAISLTLNLIP